MWVSILICIILDQHRFLIVYICILQEMLALPVIPIFCLVVVAVNTLLAVFQPIYAENTHFISKIAIREFYTKRFFFVLLGLYFEYIHTENI